jgi:hypothetical protein
VTESDKARESRLLRLYGMTIADYDALLDFQKGTCAICSRPPVLTRLAVDHDHLTKYARGLLCYVCNNKRVGSERDPDIFDRVASYLRSTPASQVFDQPRIAPPKKRKRRSRQSAQSGQSGKMKK